MRRLPRRIAASGRVLLPACPSLADHYTDLLHGMFATLGRVFSPAEDVHLRRVLERALREGFALSPHARIAVDYRTDEPPETTLSYHVTLELVTLADAYEHWVQTRTPPLFGKHPDAKVMSLARSQGGPGRVRVLDIGAGTGRNALALARAGFAVDALEAAPALAELLAAEIAREKVGVRLLRGDALGADVELPPAHYQLVVLSGVVSSHVRDAAQARALFERGARALVTGGLLVFNAFIARAGYTPDALARELSQAFWCSVFTRDDLAGALRGLPFEPVSDEPAAALERAALPPEEWPPTPWFDDWSAGRDLFELSGERTPMELRWLVYRRL